MSDPQATVICLECHSPVTVSIKKVQGLSNYHESEDSISVNLYCPTCDDEMIHSTLL